MRIKLFIIAILIAIFCLAVSVYAQEWYPADLGFRTWDTDFNDIYFTDEKNGWIVGDQGMIAHTSTGASWKAQDSGVGTDLHGVFFINPLKGWAVGDLGVILNTSDGGQNWQSQQVSAGETLYDVGFVSDLRGWIVGSNGTILSTNNGGVTWTAEQLSSDDFYSVYFLNSNNGWAVGENGQIFFWNGSTWTKESSTVTVNLYGVFAKATDNVWAVGDNGIIVHKAGSSWSFLNVAGTSLALRSILLSGDQNGWIVGDYGMILNTSDSGNSWRKYPSSPFSNHLRGLFATSIEKVWAVGDGGSIIQTLDSGLTWEFAPQFGNLRDVCFAKTNPSMGWIVGDDGTILHTADGGVTWTEQTSPTLKSLYGVFFLDDNNGWAVGEESTIIRTTNGGVDWQLVGSNQQGDLLRSVYFADTSNGWIVGDFGNILYWNGSVWTSRNWTSTTNLYGVQFIGTGIGYVVGDNGLLITTNNGGITWDQIPTNVSNLLISLSFVNANVGWIVGNGGIILQKNGNNIITQSSGTTATLYDVDFINGSEGWIVGDFSIAKAGATLLSTTNGGGSWASGAIQQARSTMYAVDFTSNNSAIAVGRTGNILRFTANLPAIKFELISPSGDIDTLTPTFRWKTTRRDVTHTLYINKSSDPFQVPNLYVIPVVYETSYTLPKEIQLSSGTYYWGIETPDGTRSAPNEILRFNASGVTVSKPPVVSDIANQTVAEGSPFTSIKLDDFVTDGDNTDFEITWSVSGNVNINVILGADHIATISAKDPEWNGSETVTFTGTDPGGLSASDSVTFTVTPINDPPRVSNIADQTVAEGKPFANIRLDNFVTDPDNADANITWSFTGSVYLTITIGADRVAVITLKDPEWNGIETIIFTAKDPDGLSTSDSAKFTITPVNEPPVVSEIPDQTANEGNLFFGIKLDDFVADPDDTDAYIAWSVTDNNNIIVTIVDRVAIISVNDPGWSGSETVTFTAKDPGGLSASDSAKFTITPINNSPIISNISDQTVEEGKPFASIKLDDFVADPDNADAQIVWSFSGNVNLNVAIGADRMATITTKNPEWNGSETITFTAKDPSGLSTSDAVKFTVTPINDPPVVSDIPDQSIIAGQNFADIKLDDYVTDPDNADSQIVWSFSGSTNLLIAIDANRIAKITTLDKNWRGSETVTFTAKDPAGLTASNQAKLELKILLGDMNKDDKLGSGDVIIILRISVEIVQPDSYEKVAGDMNKDGKILSNDAILLLRTIVGLAAPDLNSSVVQTPINFSIPDIRGVAGDVLMLPLEVDNTQSLAGGDIQIAYDSNVLQALDVSTLQNTAMASNVSQKGIIQIAFAGSNRLNGRTLANIKFRVIRDDISPIKVKNISLYNLNGSPIKAVYTDREFRSWAIAPDNNSLMQNYPNPFNPETWIPFQLKDSANVKIRIYKQTGELVRELDLGYKPAGVYISSDRAGYWDGKDKYGQQVSSGTYFYSIDADNFSAVKKFIILK